MVRLKYSFVVSAGWVERCMLEPLARRTFTSVPNFEATLSISVWYQISKRALISSRSTSMSWMARPIALYAVWISKSRFCSLMVISRSGCSTFFNTTRLTIVSNSLKLARMPCALVLVSASHFYSCCIRADIFSSSTNRWYSIASHAVITAADRSMKLSTASNRSTHLVLHKPFS